MCNNNHNFLLELTSRQILYHHRNCDWAPHAPICLTERVVGHIAVAAKCLLLEAQTWKLEELSQLLLLGDLEVLQLLPDDALLVFTLFT